MMNGQRREEPLIHEFVATARLEDHLRTTRDVTPALVVEVLPKAKVGFGRAVWREEVDVQPLLQDALKSRQESFRFWLAVVVASWVDDTEAPEVREFRKVAESKFQRQTCYPVLS